MPVRRRLDSTPDAWWIDFRVGGKRYLLTRRAPNKRGAKDLERELRAAIEAGHAQQRGKATVKDAFARYWQEHGRFLASARTEGGYLNRWADVLGDQSAISAVTPGTIAQCVAKWRTSGALDTHRQPRDRQRVTDSTINHRLLCLQRIWNRAEELWGWKLARIPWRRLKLPERREYPDRSIGRATLRALLRTLSPRSRPIVMLALVTGLRRGALLRLQSSDIDTVAGIIRAISKGRAGGKLTPVPITRKVRWVLRRSGFDGMATGRDSAQWRDRRDEDRRREGRQEPAEAQAERAALVRAERRDVRLLHADALAAPRIGKLFAVSAQLLRQDWHEARMAIGMPHLLFRDLRHTFAQSLEDAGAGDLITDALHHSDPRLRKRYSHVRMDRLRERLDRIGRR